MNDIDLDLFDLDDIPPDHRSGFVALIGRPNVGKSTLMNSLLGQKVAIVSPRPQTTRNRILGIMTRPEYQIIFVDTPGIHRPRHELGRYMVATARSAIPDADVILFMVDVSVNPTREDQDIARLITARASDAPVILVMNKMDRLKPDKVEAHCEAYWGLGQGDWHQDWMMTTATTGDNLDKLLGRVVAALPQGPRYYPGDQITDQTEREIAAELIREQVLRYTRQEVPHSVAVVVEDFKARSETLTYVGANVFVERSSQKGIIIGKKGQMLRKIGAAARPQIERLTGTKVYLELWVKVSEGWRKDERWLRRLGYK
ncbi:MAG: GTPase Era [Anaerolineae bacterium]|jgi:GTP-binding protein Era